MLKSVILHCGSFVLLLPFYQRCDFKCIYFTFDDFWFFSYSALVFSQNYHVKGMLYRE